MILEKEHTQLNLLVSDNIDDFLYFRKINFYYVFKFINNVMDDLKTYAIERDYYYNYKIVEYFKNIYENIKDMNYYNLFNYLIDNNILDNKVNLIYDKNLIKVTLKDSIKGQKKKLFLALLKN